MKRRTNCHRRNPERHRCRSLCAGRETGQGTAGQGGDDVQVDGKDSKVGVIPSLGFYTARDRIIPDTLLIRKKCKFQEG